MSNASEEHRDRIRQFLATHGLHPENLELVERAFVHRSYAFENDGIADNERLEFLGDAVLGCLAADFLYRRFPDDPEGDLSKKKAFLVSRRELARRADAIGLSELVLLGRGEESSGGRARVSIVGSALEALVGAIYYNLPADAVREFCERWIFDPALEKLQGQQYPDFKSRLQELVQKNEQSVPDYVKIGEVGPPHDRSYLVEVHVGGRCMGSGEGPRIKIAENRAAQQALDAYQGLMKDLSDKAP